MDLIFLEKPVVALVVFLPIIVLHIAAFLLKGRRLSIFVEILGVAVHSCAIAVVWMMGGGYEDVLVLVLFSAVLALLRHRPEKRGKEGDK